MQGKAVSESTTEQAYMLMPKHSNGMGRLFGGRLMEWIDEVGAMAAQRHCNSLVTTASVDNLNFRHSAVVGDVVVLISRVTFVGNTSLEVRVDTYVEQLGGQRKLINHAYLVMVSVDENYRPQPVPPLILETERDRTEWENGKRRHELRKARRQEGY